MPYRILNYCIDIIQEWKKSKKINQNTRYPIIVPIIIYTGNEKWKIPKNFKEKQISDYVFENYKIDLEYNLIEINKLSKSFLLQKQSLFGYGMIIEKSNITHFGQLKMEKLLMYIVDTIISTMYIRYYQVILLN